MYERRIDGFTAETFHHDGCAVVVVRGEVDMATADTFAVALLAAVEEGGRVEVDLRETTFMDSSGLAVLIRGHRALGSAPGAEIVLRAPHPAVRRLLDLAGVRPLFAVEDGPTAGRGAADGQGATTLSTQS